MRVTHVVENLNRGGLERVVLDLAREQAMLGHAPQVVCLFEAGQLADELAANGIEIVACHKRRGLDRRALAILREAVRRHDAVVIHSHNAVAHYHAVLATLGHDLKRINTRHGMGDYPFNRRRELTYRLSLLATDTVVAVCEAARQNFIRQGVFPVSKACTVPNGIRTELFSVATEEARRALRSNLGFAKDDLLVGCVARLNEAKDHGTLLRAVALLRKERRQVGLLLVGDGALRERLVALTVELGIADAVRFLGDRGDVPQLLSGLDVFALSSLTEGYSISLLEACAAGLPIVASHVGGNAEIVEHNHNGRLVAARDAQAFAAALSELLMDARLRDTMGKASRSFAEQQGSVHLMATLYIDLYRRGGQSAVPATSSSKVA